ncbi:MAG: oligosaccharide flippase family protein [Proteobacteria bacterium]|nr:oligosaccharide flippase family protein [Pseudomonadota bacterium]
MSGAEQDTRLDLERVASTTVSTTAIVGIRLVCQALALMLSARLLGADGFGSVAAVVAVSLVLGPWGGLGYDFVALRTISRAGRGSGAHFRRGISLIVRTSVPMVIAVSTAAWLWTRDSSVVELVLLVLTAELVFLRAVELIAKIFQGNDRFGEMGLTRLTISVSRLMVLGMVALLASRISATQWGWANLVAAVLALVVAVAFLRRRQGLSMADRAGTAPPLRDGLYFAAGITSMRLSTEFDKSLVLGIAGALGAGVYGAAHRIVSLAVAPVISLVNVVVTSFFRLGSHVGGRQLRRRSLVVCGVAVVYGLVVGVFLWFYLPDVAALALGEEFRALAVGLLPLSLLVVPASCRIVGEQAVAAMGRFRLRLAIQWAVAALSVILNLLMIAHFGWQGAAWVLMLTETLLAVGFVAIVAFSDPLLPEPDD